MYNLLEKVAILKRLINEFHISPKDSISIIDLVKIIFLRFVIKIFLTKNYLTFGPERKEKSKLFARSTKGN